MRTTNKKTTPITTKEVFANCFIPDAIYSVDCIRESAFSGDFSEIILNENFDNEPTIQARIDFLINQKSDFGNDQRDMSEILGLHVTIESVLLNEDKELFLNRSEQLDFEESIKALILKEVA